jgi:hypothetical protein
MFDWAPKTFDRRNMFGPGMATLLPGNACPDSSSRSLKVVANHEIENKFCQSNVFGAQTNMGNFEPSKNVSASHSPFT